MKKIALLALSLLMILALVACGEEKTNENSGQIVLKPIENLSEYVIIKPKESSSEESLMITKFKKAINEATGASVAVKTDDSVSEYEILIGATAREESVNVLKELRSEDYTVRKIGNKIVIAGGNSESLVKAIELFQNQFIDSEKKVVKIPSGAGYTYKANYIFDKLTVDGVDFGEFKLINNSYIDSVELLTELCGTPITLHEGEPVDGEHYLILDGSELIAHKYSVKIENGNIIIRGSAHSIHNALDYFKNNVLKSDSKTIEISSGVNYEGSTGKKEIYTTDQLAKVIEKVYENPNQIIIGEQTKGLHETAIEESIQKFKDATGEMPGIIGIDLGCYGFDLPVTTEMQWSAYICDMVDYAAEGGIITASAHWANPSENWGDDAKCRGRLGYDDSLEAYEQGFIDLITEGTEYNDFFKNELESNARFFKALEDNGVSIIWRPLHEANGNWFWFCIGQSGYWLEPEYLIDVWHYIYDYFENECGLTNLYWCYGPNWSANVKDSPDSSGTRSTTYLYPGDEYRDMVGVDWYTAGNLEITTNTNYLNLTDLSRKPGAITEFGPGGVTMAENIEDQPKYYNSMDLYNNLYELVRKEYSFVYLLTWGSKWGIPAMGRGDELMQTDLCIGQAEVKAMFDALK